MNERVDLASGGTGTDWAKVLSHAAMSYKQYSTGWKILSFPAEFFYGAERSMTCSKKKTKKKAEVDFGS